MDFSRSLLVPHAGGGEPDETVRGTLLHAHRDKGYPSHGDHGTGRSSSSPSYVKLYFKKNVRIRNVNILTGELSRAP